MPAADGTFIPVSLVYRKGLRRDGSAPMYLKGYGAYGDTPSLSVFSNDLSMLERGIVVATAQVRGGADLGEAWHDAGGLLVGTVLSTGVPIAFPVRDAGSPYPSPQYAFCFRC